MLYLGWVAKQLKWEGGASELMRNKKQQKKAVNYGINKLTPFIQESVGTAMDQLSTKLRPKKKYKTDRKDLDRRGGSRGRVQGVRTPPWDDLRPLSN